MSHTTLSTAVTRSGTAPRAATSVLSSPAAVLVTCLVALAALVADAASGEAELAIVGVAAMALALAMTMTEALRADVGRPSRTTRRAAATARAASVLVAAFLACVGVLERSGPQVTSSAAFAAGVAVMSVLLLVVLPLGSSSSAGACCGTGGSEPARGCCRGCWCSSSPVRSSPWP